MVKINVDMVRKKAEHHDRLLAPLEEISLHQENIEKIEFLQDWCPILKILLLQNNLIAKIENLNKLKHLQYLNLALNNIEVVENLNRCESLNKLDLTLNFIGNIVSVESLAGSLPQLMSLDGEEIDRSHRITSLQNLPLIRSDILFEQDNYLCQRQKQKARLQSDITYKWENEYKNMDPEERNKKFWAEKCEHAPEVRYEIERMRKLKLISYEPKKNEVKRSNKLFAPDGRPFNINQAKIDFLFSDNEREKFVLDLAVYKHLDSTLLDIDVQPNYVRATIKGKIFQLHLPEEVDTSNSTAERSSTTGHLVVTLPKINSNLKMKMASKVIRKINTQTCNENNFKQSDMYEGQSKREFLEIGPVDDVLDFTKMTERKSSLHYRDPRLHLGDKKPSVEFLDNPDVPPLI